MANDYLKIGKLYTLNTTANVTITGAGFIHSIHNTSSAAIGVCIDNAYRVQVPADNSTIFLAPLAFSGVKMVSANTTGTILYS